MFKWYANKFIKEKSKWWISILNNSVLLVKYVIIDYSWDCENVDLPTECQLQCSFILKNPLRSLTIFIKIFIYFKKKKFDIKKMKDKILFSQRESVIRAMDVFDAKNFKDSSHCWSFDWMVKIIKDKAFIKLWRFWTTILEVRLYFMIMRRH